MSNSEVPLPRGFLQKMIQFIGKEEIRGQIQGQIIDPLLNHVLRRVFPYIILTCVLFVLLLLAVLLTLGIIVFQLRWAPAAPGGVAATVAGSLP